MKLNDRKIGDKVWVFGIGESPILPTLVVIVGIHSPTQQPHISIEQPDGCSAYRVRAFSTETEAIQSILPEIEKTLTMRNVMISKLTANLEGEKKQLIVLSEDLGLAKRRLHELGEYGSE